MSRHAGEAPSPLSAVPYRPPRLEGARVLLRGYEPDDAAAIYAYASDAEVTPYMAWDRHASIADARFYLNEVVAEHYRNRRLDYAICLRTRPEQVIGGVGVYPQTPAHHKVYELGYVLGRPYWGRGLVPEGARLLIDHAFRTSDAERIFAPIFSENEKSRRAAEKLGMMFEGVLRSAVYYRGRRWDQAMYAIVRAEWQASASG